MDAASAGGRPGAVAWDVILVQQGFDVVEHLDPRKNGVRDTCDIK